MAVDGQQPPLLAVDEQQPPLMAVEVVDDKNKSPRHPRWTRQETLTLIEGKKVAENRGRRGRRSSSVFGSDHVEPKWDSVSSYCKKRAVNRGPVQCRKRWSNMVGDYKKIKAWESQVKQECDSYWVMRNDLRKENKMPGFFDREVFDVLDGKAVTKEAYKLALVTVSTDANHENEVSAMVGEAEEEGGGGGGDAEVEVDVTFDSGRRATSYEGLFPEYDKLEEVEIGNGKGHDNASPDIHDPMPISEKRYQPFYMDFTQAGNMQEQHQNPIYWKESMPQEGCNKRKRVSTDESRDKDFNDRLINVLEKNGEMLNARMEAENTNSQLDREQGKEYNDSMVSALNKIAEALTKIADKL
ncbi:trihelix transcription factor ASR3-like [Bidens hawaiensis]|uniref:trihelix transcription factor ASR3-like n=1 Tax=Bidens hawaiensis TaxID=980011 RepID=UPI00404B96B8